jgi:glycine C-acetyltransferase
MGFDTGKSVTPITPVMLGEAKLAQKFSQSLFDEGVFAMAIGYPTVAQGKARIRAMMSAALSEQDIEQALAAFESVGKNLGLIA